MILLKNKYIINAYNIKFIIKEILIGDTNKNIILASRYIINEYKRQKVLIELYKNNTTFEYKLNILQELPPEAREAYMIDLINKINLFD